MEVILFSTMKVISKSCSGKNSRTVEQDIYPLVVDVLQSITKNKQNK